MKKDEKAKKEYSVIFDTNIVIYGNPLQKEVNNLIKNFENHPEVKLVYYLPEVVIDEIQSKIPDILKGAIDRRASAIREINSIMGTDIVDSKISFNSSQILGAVSEILTKNHLKTLKTPNISLKSILQKAILHEPPFKSNGDKGLKDAVIAETIKHYAEKLSQHSSVVFISADTFFREYMLSIGNQFNFEVYQSVEEFESDLKLNLLLTGDADRLGDSVADEAGKIFFIEDDKNTLFYMDAWNEIYRRFPSLFSNPKPNRTSLSYLSPYDESGQIFATGKAKYNIFRPLFIRKEGQDTLVWESTIDYSQNYDQYRRSTQTDMNYLSYGMEKVAYNLRFIVKWSIKMASQGKLDDSTAKVIDVDHIKYTDGFFHAPLNIGYSPSPISGPTGLSGTVTASEISASASSSVSIHSRSHSHSHSTRHSMSSSASRSHDDEV